MDKNIRKDFPVEQTIHYIVKDYRRMFHEHDKLVETISALKEQLHKKSNENTQLKYTIDSIREKIKAKQTDIDNLKRKLDRKPKPNGCTITLHAETEGACSILFHEKGGICHEHRLTYEEMGCLYAIIRDYLQTNAR